MVYNVVKPDPMLSDFVEIFWMLASNTEEDKDIVIFAWSTQEPFDVMLMNMDQEASC